MPSCKLQLALKRAPFEWPVYNSNEKWLFVNNMHGRVGSGSAHYLNHSASMPIVLDRW